MLRPKLLRADWAIQPVIKVTISVLLLCGTFSLEQMIRPPGFPSSKRQIKTLAVSKFEDLKKVKPEDVEINGLELDSSGNTIFHYESLNGNIQNNFFDESVYSPYFWSVRLKDINGARTTLDLDPLGKLRGFHFDDRESSPLKLPSEAGPEALVPLLSVCGIDLRPYSLVQNSGKTAKDPESTTYQFRAEPKSYSKDFYYLYSIRVSNSLVTDVKQTVVASRKALKEIDALAHKATNFYGFISIAIETLMVIVSIGIVFLFRDRLKYTFKKSLYVSVSISVLGIVMLAPNPRYLQEQTLQNHHLAIYLFFYGGGVLNLFLITLTYLLLNDRLNSQGFKKNSEGTPWTNVISLSSFMVTYTSVFSIIGLKAINLWSPAKFFDDPALINSHLSGLYAASRTIYPAVFEEILFRGVPLSIAVWLSDRFRISKCMIWIVLFLQGIIFGVSHNHFPFGPRFGDILALGIPGLILGLCYLRYNLTTCVVIHFTANLLLASFDIIRIFGFSQWQDLLIIVAFIVLSISQTAAGYPASWKSPRT